MKNQFKGISLICGGGVAVISQTLSRRKPGNPKPFTHVAVKVDSFASWERMK
jgi:hypothetical protein